MKVKRGQGLRGLCENLEAPYFLEKRNSGFLRTIEASVWGCRYEIGK